MLTPRDYRWVLLYCDRLYDGSSGMTCTHLTVMAVALLGMGVTSAPIIGRGEHYDNIEYLVYGQIFKRLESFFSIFISFNLLI